MHTPNDLESRLFEVRSRLEGRLDHSDFSCWHSKDSASLGKGFRSTIYFSVCDALDVYEALYDIAVAIELLHNASLIHDDWMDHDEVRRGRPTAWKILGDHSAVLLGDALIAESFAAIVDSGCDSATSAMLIRWFTQATRDASRGQTLQLASRSGRIPSIDEYIEWTRLKTGALIALPAKAAALLAGRQDLIKPLTAVAEHVGLAYQIRDDLCDELRMKAGRSGNSDQKCHEWSYPEIVRRLNLGDPVDTSLTAFKTYEALIGTALTKLPQSLAESIRRATAKILEPIDLPRDQDKRQYSEDVAI